MDQGTPIPKCIEYFKRNSVSIKSVALSAFHSLFLSHTGDLYAVGHGVGGRLGHGQESTVVQPQKLNLRLKRTDEKIISFSASKNHSLILSNLNNVSIMHYLDDKIPNSDFTLSPPLRSTPVEQTPGDNWESKATMQICLSSRTSTVPPCKIRTWCE